VSSLGFSIGNFLAGCNMLKVDLAASAAMTLLALGLKIAFTRAWGMPGVVWGLNLAFTLSFPLYAVFIPRLLRRMRLKGGTLEDSLWLT